MRRFRYVVLGGLVVLMLIFSGLSFAAPRALTVWTWDDKMLDFKAAYEKAHNGVKLNIQVMPWDQIRDQLLTSLAAHSNYPDVIALSASFAPAMMEAGAFAKVPFKTAEVKRYDSVEWKTYEWNNKPYGVPYDLDLNVVFYRSDIINPYLAKLGLKDFPKTWDEYLKLGRAVKKDGLYLTFVQINSWRAYYYRYLSVNKGLVYNPKAKKFVFNGKAGVEALDFMKTMIDEEIGLKWAANWADVMPALKSGKVLSFNMGPWYGDELKAQAPELSGKWRVAALPSAKNNYPGTVLNGTALAVINQSTNKALAWDYIRFLTSDENMIAYFQKVGSLPAVKTVWSNQIFSKSDPYFGNQKVYQLIREIMKNSTPFQLFPKQTEAESIFTKYIGLAHANQMSSKDALNAAALEASKLIDQ
jgi:multiple sugar transport system substrate-binding protein